MGKVLAPHMHITRDDNLYSSERNLTSKLCIFPFYVSLFFGVDKGVPLFLSILRCDEEFRPT